jgi:hypothetical protein
MPGSHHSGFESRCQIASALNDDSNHVENGKKKKKKKKNSTRAAVDLDALRPTLEESAYAIADRQEASLLGRKALAELTRGSWIHAID